MDKLVELFLQSARIGSAEQGQEAEVGGRLRPEAIEHGVDAVEKMLSSEDAIRMGGAPVATFVCLAMALEEKPHLQGGAVRCYEKALEILDRKPKRRTGDGSGSWERSVVLQQLGVVCLRQGQLQEGKRWLSECLAECAKAEGHPRDVVLFGGGLNTQQTRVEFVAMVEKLLTKIYQQLGDEVQARAHYQNVERLSRLQSGDAVERAVAKEEASTMGAKVVEEQSRTPSGVGAGAAPAAAAGSTPRALWASHPVEERTLKEYRYVDEGPTVAVLLELNEHLGIGEEGSAAVQSLQQFRVHCDSESVDIQLRLERKDNQVWHFNLRLAPLVNEIIPEDTVPRLRGREGKRRLEVKLFKKDKKTEWRGNLVQAIAPKPATTSGTTKVSMQEARGTALNPLTSEELASLPRPSGGKSDNRPSEWQPGPKLLKREDQPAPANVVTKTADKCASEDKLMTNVAKTDSDGTGGASNKIAPRDRVLPDWVASMEEKVGDGTVDLLVQIAQTAGETISMQDLELGGDISSGFRLRFLKDESAPALDLPQAAGVDMEAVKAKWRRKTRTLELQFPQV